MTTRRERDDDHYPPEKRLLACFISYLAKNLSLYQHLSKRMAENATNNAWAEADERSLRVAVLDLHRLLRCMEQREAPPDLSWQSIEGRANLAQDLLRKVHEGWHAASYENESMRAEDEARYVQLEQQVDKACRRARDIAAERKADEVDLIQEIFFPEKKNDSVLNEEEKKDVDDDDRNELHSQSVDQDEDEPLRNEQRHEHAPERTAPLVPRSTSHDVEELQKAQRDQLEAEIAHMAARLKESTQQMNTTLRTQTEVRKCSASLNVTNV